MSRIIILVLIMGLTTGCLCKTESKDQIQVQCAKSRSFVPDPIAKPNLVLPQPIGLTAITDLATPVIPTAMPIMPKLPAIGVNDSTISAKIVVPTPIIICISRGTTLAILPVSPASPASPASSPASPILSNKILWFDSPIWLESLIWQTKFDPKYINISSTAKPIEPAEYNTWGYIVLTIILFTGVIMCYIKIFKSSKKSRINDH